MAQSLRKKKILNMVYGLGAAIVLVGALFKILHLSIGPITGAVMLTIGLLTEAFIFAYSAFFEPIEEDLIWTNVYPELTGGEPKERPVVGNFDEAAEGLMTKRLDEMLKQSNLDAELIGSLSSSIESFKGAAENLKSSSDTVAATTTYNEQLAAASANMESLNSLYQVQSENTKRQAELNDTLLKNSEKLEAQMESLASNLSSLNSVYGGMLSAMNK
ncbi:MAG: gliding motility protein GldL [Flavicella sp.]